MSFRDDRVVGRGGFIVRTRWRTWDDLVFGGTGRNTVQEGMQRLVSSVLGFLNFFG